MYVPRAFALPDETVGPLLAERGSVELVTFDGVRPVASRIPALWQPAEPGTDGQAGDGEVRGRVLGHLARANPQWSTVAPGSQALAIVTGAEGYISPSWYPSKAEHGRVVPTWNYVAVHLTGSLVLHDDPDWLRDVVTRLTRTHEDGRAEQWSVHDAPAEFIAKSLRAIVGVELLVSAIEVKGKLSQNRSPEDVAGVLHGLRSEAGVAGQVLADTMESYAPAPSSE